MKLYVIYLDANKNSVCLQNDLKTENGYINRATKCKGEMTRVKYIEFYQCSHENFYKTKLYKTVEVNKNIDPFGHKAIIDKQNENMPDAIKNMLNV
jgi:hypothetical protein